MSSMYIFEAGAFTPELIGFDGDGDEIRIMKVGGGTLGEEYEGTFLVEVKSTQVGTPLDRFEIHHGAPHSHWATLMMVLDAREDDSK